MRFSIVIPTYNYASRLPKALDSVLNQDGDDYEIIVIDDGSTDETETVIQPYLSSKLRYIKQTNQGPAAARNQAIAQAKADYIYPLDADDQLLPSALATMSAAIKEHPEATIITAQQKTKTPQFSKNLEQNFINYLRKRFSIPHGSVIMKRELFQQINYPASVRGREDIVFFAQALAIAPAVSLPTAVFSLCKHADSYRHQLDQQHGNLNLVEQLFNPQRLPKPLFKYKKEFTSRLCLSFFRDHYRAGNYATARHWYWRAIKASPARLLQWRYLSKLLRSILKS